MASSWWLLPALLATGCLACVPGYHPTFDGWCMKMNWKEKYDGYETAQQLCAADGAIPLIIRNAEDNKKFMDVLTKPHSIRETSKIFIGLTCDPEQGRFVWPDGSIANYTNFGHFDYRCESDATSFYINMTTGVWTRHEIDPNIGHHHMKESPGRVVHIVACMQQRRPNNQCGNFDLVANANGSTVCVFVHATKESWKNAAEKCAKEHAVLAAINDHILRTAQILKMEGVHIGLQTTNYSWLSGDDVEYSNFTLGFPEEANFGDCVAMNADFLPGQWANVPCDTLKLPYACTKEPVTEVAVPKPKGCPKNFRYFAGDDIYSPGFPSNGSTADCTYLVTVEKGKRVKLTVKMFEANVCCDMLYIYDGIFGSRHMEATAGFMEAGKSITSTSNAIRLVWKAKSGKNVRGFHFTVDAVDAPGPHDLPSRFYHLQSWH